MKADLLPADTQSGSADSSPKASCVRKGFQRVLVPSDFSAPSLKALHYATALASESVHLLHVFEPLPSLVVAQALSALEADDEVAAKCSRELERIADPHRRGDLQIACSVRAGVPGPEITDFASEWRADLIILSTHGRTGLRHLLLGSVAEKVLRHASCPVLLLRKHEHDFVKGCPGKAPEATVERILVPTDFSPRSAEGIRYACNFASHFGGKITLLHSVHIAGLFGTQEFPGIDAGPIITAAETNARAQVHDQLESLVPTPLRGAALIAVGPPLNEIPTVAVEGNFDLIICATHGQASVRHAFLGSTAEGLARHAYCPVLVVPANEGRARDRQNAPAPGSIGT